MQRLVLLALCCALNSAAAVLDRNPLTPGGGEMPLPATFSHYPAPDKLGGFRSAVDDGGGKVLQLTDNSDKGEIGIAKSYPAEPGKYYRATVEIKLPEGTVEKNPPVFYFQLTFLPVGKNVQTRLSPRNGAYQSVEVSGQAPEKTEELLVFVYSQRQPQGAMLVRNYQLEVSDRPFADPPEVRTATTVRLHAGAGKVNPATAALAADPNFPGGVIALKPGSDGKAGESDVTFAIRAPKPGRYNLVSCTSLDDTGRELMRKASSKFQSLMLTLSLDGSTPTRRVAYSPWINQPAFRSVLGKFDFTGNEQALTVKLPAGLRLGYLEISPYTPPSVPPEAAAYQPKITPSEAHPRLWVTPAELPLIRARLENPAHRAAWEWLKEQALTPFAYTAEPGKEAAHNQKLQDAAVRKAFYYLVTGDQKTGREAVALQKAYLPAVSFGNILDITREIGSAIYAASLVYDWCYPLLTEPDRELFHRHLLRLADDMEIGWPPFKQSAVNGHGNEAQVNRDLLAMAIALYGRDNQPYQYCAYRLLEEVIPMRRVEYQSPRHNQGVSYGSYRFGWEMHAAWLLRRMTGREVYPDNLKNLGNYWLYARLPDGQLLRDGDGIPAGVWNYPLTALLMYTYAADPVMKGEFNRQSNWQIDPLLYLLLDDPALPAQSDLNVLPLARDTGDILGSLVMRTGWTVAPVTDDVVAEMRGGGVHFGGHMHTTGGAFQLFYRGIQAADLGQYHFFGTPYDYNFAKRSASKNVMLVYDPAETFANGGNDGGQRFVLRSPDNLKDMLASQENQAGKVLASEFGPSTRRPLYGVFSVDLARAYSSKVTGYVRRFVFLNLGDPAHPAALLIADRIVAARPEFKKYFQLNTLVKPVPTADGLRAANRVTKRVGTMYVNMFRPAPDERKLEIIGGSPDQPVFGRSYPSPAPAAPEGHGYRALFSPLKPGDDDLFATAITLADSGAEELPVGFAENGPALLFSLKEWVVAMPAGLTSIDAPFDFAVPAGSAASKVLFTGLADRDWTLRSADGKTTLRMKPSSRGGVLLTTLGAGNWRALPEASRAAPEAPVVRDEAPELPDPAGRQAGDDDVMNLAALRPLLAGRKVEVTEKADLLTFKRGNDVAILRDGAAEVELNGQKIPLPAPARRGPGGWQVPTDFAADFTGCRFDWDEAGKPVLIEHPVNSELAAAVFRFESKLSNPPEEFRAMLLPEDLRHGYWASSGREAVFELVFFRPVELSGIGIKWLLGSSRKSCFKLETSADGKTYQTVFDGESSGATEEFEDVKFARRPVLRLRFTGRGNSDSAWNSIVGLRLLP